MRIEISAGGLSGAISVAEYELNMSSFINETDSIISSFQTVTTAIASLNGGIGDLEDAFNDLADRIEIEEEKRQDAQEVLNKSTDFIELAKRVDREVADLVNRNREEFYEVNPWLRPADDSVPWYEAVWNFLTDKGEWIAESIQKLWKSCIEFLDQNKRTIFKILGSIVILICTAIAVYAGTTIVAALIAAIGSASGVLAAIAGVILTALAVLSVVTSVVSAVLGLIDLWAEIDDAEFQKWKKIIGWADLGLGLFTGLAAKQYLMKVFTRKIAADFAKVTTEQLVKDMTVELSEEYTDDIIEQLAEHLTELYTQARSKELAKLFADKAKDIFKNINKLDGIGKLYDVINMGYDLINDNRIWTSVDLSDMWKSLLEHFSLLDPTVWGLVKFWV